jgi:outer membrane protein
MSTTNLTQSRSIRRTLLVLLGMALSVGTMQSAMAEDLMTVYRLAQMNDPTLLSAKYQLDVVYQKIPQARANLLPVIVANGSDSLTLASTAFNEIPATPFGDIPAIDRDTKSWNWNVQITQPLFRAENIYAYKESELIVAQAEAQYENAKQDLFVRVAQTYFAENEAQDAIAAADAQTTALEEQLAQVTKGLQEGTHSLTDVDDTKSRLGTARAQRVSAQNDLENAIADLEKITGKVIYNLSPLRANAILPEPNPRSSREWMEQARINHPLVLAQQAAMAAAKIDIKKNRADHLPTLDLVANYGNNWSSHSLTTPNDYSTRAKQNEVGIQLTVPLFAGGSTNSKVVEAIAAMNKAEADLEVASRQASNDAQHAFAGVTNGLAQIDALNVAVESGQSALKGNQAGYKLGIKINVDVLNAQQQLFTAQRDLSKARYETMLQGLKLKAAAGALDETDFEMVNGMLH